MKTAFLLGVCCLSVSLITTQPIDEQSKQDREHRSHMFNLITGPIIARTLYALAELKIADQMSDIPTHSDLIAQSVSADPHALYRALRLAASYGIFKEGPAHHFSLTPCGQLLQTNHPDSMHFIALHEDEARWQALGNLTHSLTTGEQAFKHTHGMNYFEFLAQNKQAAERFDESMATISEQENRALASCFDVAPYSTVVDVGGGYGGLINEITKAHPDVNGVLYDLPYVFKKKNALLTQVAEKCQIKEGSFFDAVPEGGDLYILKRIMHDWDDAQAIKILKKCAQIPGARILVIDALVPEGNHRNPSKEIDVLLLALFGGKERTLQEFKVLFDASGLKLVNVWETPSLLSICELVAA